MNSRQIVKAATVRLPSVGGQGVLVSGGLVLTAAHCVTWSGTGGMALGDEILEDVEPRAGNKFRMQVVAGEPVCDIAVLGCVDEQVHYDDGTAHEEWVSRTKPVPLRTRFLRMGKPIAVYVLTHHGAWIRAKATRWGDVGTVAIESRKQIEGGTSGGPIVDDDGHLVGVVSFSSEGGKSCNGACPFAVLALPGWVVAQIRRAERDGAS